MLLLLFNRLPSLCFCAFHPPLSHPPDATPLRPHPHPPSLPQLLAWHERFIVTLPPDLAEQLLAPAPGDNPYAATGVQLRLSLYDLQGQGGMGALVGQANLEVRRGVRLVAGACMRTLRSIALWVSEVVGVVQNLWGFGCHSRLTTPSHPCFCLPCAPFLCPVQLDFDWLAGQVEALRKRAQSQHGLSAAGGAGAAAVRGSAMGAMLGRTCLLEVLAAGAGAADAVSATAAEPPAAMQLTLRVAVDDSLLSSSWAPHNTASGRAASAADAAAAGGPGLQALRLEGSDMWTPFSRRNLQRGAGTTQQLGSGVVPIRAGGAGLALELNFEGVGRKGLGRRAGAEWGWSVHIGRVGVG